MTLDKIVKKEKKSLNQFFSLMAFLFLLLPLILFLSGVKNVFIFCFLLLIEFLIVVCVLNRANFYTLKFYSSLNRIRIKSGLFSKECLLMYDKVLVLHTEKTEEDIEIIVVTTVNVKNKKLKPITESFIKKYPEAAHEYLRLKKMYPENLYYYQVIKKGGFKKYLLLDMLFKNCVRAVITTSAIENIKISRGQCEL